MNEIRAAYLEACGSALALLRTPAVVENWHEPSSLPGLTVGGLAAHLGAQVYNGPVALATDGTDPIALLDHYARAAWVTEDRDGPANTATRATAEAAGEPGPAAVAERVATALAALEAALPGTAADRVVSPPWLAWSLRLDDFLVTRLMEIAVHSDDLAHSVGQPTPPLPPAVIEPAVDLLTRLALRRHGQAAVLRALSRAERAPATIAAF